MHVHLHVPSTGPPNAHRPLIDEYTPFIARRGGSQRDNKIDRRRLGAQAGHRVYTTRARLTRKHPTPPGRDQTDRHTAEHEEARRAEPPPKGAPGRATGGAGSARAPGGPTRAPGKFVVLPNSDTPPRRFPRTRPLSRPRVGPLRRIGPCR